MQGCPLQGAYGIYRCLFPINCTALALQVGHKDFVSALAYIPAGEQYPKGAVVSGSRDATVMIWDVSTGELLQTLEGHQYQVGQHTHFMARSQQATHILTGCGTSRLQLGAYAFAAP